MSDERAALEENEEPPLVSVETLRYGLLRGTVQSLLTSLAASAFFVFQVITTPGGSFDWLPRILLSTLAFGFVAAPVALLELRGRRRLPTPEWTLQSAALACGVAILAGGFLGVSVHYAGAMLSERSPTAGIEAVMQWSGSGVGDWAMSLVRYAIGGLVYGLLVALRLREVGLGKQVAFCFALTLVTAGLNWTLIAVRHLLLDGMGPGGLAQLAGWSTLQSATTAALALPVGWRLADRLHDRWWGDAVGPWR